MARIFVVLILLFSSVAAGGCISGNAFVFEMESLPSQASAAYSNGLKFNGLGLQATLGPDLRERDVFLFAFQRSAGRMNQTFAIDATGNYAVKESWRQCVARNSSDAGCDRRYALVEFATWGRPWLWGASALLGSQVRDGERIEGGSRFGEERDWFRASVLDGGRVLELRREGPGSEGGFFRSAALLRFGAGVPVPVLVEYTSGGAAETVRLVAYDSMGTRIVPTGHLAEPMPSPEGVALGEMPILPGPPEETDYRGFALSEAIEVARELDAGARSAIENPSAWLRWGEGSSRAAVTLCPTGGVVDPPTSLNTTVEEIHQWRYSIDTLEGVSSYLVEKRRKEGFDPEYSVETVPNSDEAKLAMQRPPSGGWVALDWGLAHAVRIGEFQPDEVTIGFRPDPADERRPRYWFAANPYWAEVPGECEAGSWAGGAYFVHIDGTTGSLISLMNHPSVMAPYV